MARFPALVLAPMLLAGCMTANEAGTTDRADAARSDEARAVLASADGAPRGTATLNETSGGLTLHVAAEGLPPGPHGIHIHTVGRCDAPDFQTAGAHWNPTSRQHGHDNPQGAHQGDLPNINIGADGRGTLHASVPGANFAELFDADGAAVVIHAAADDYRTDPSGNSGGRIACGVLTRP